MNKRRILSSIILLALISTMRPGVSLADHHGGGRRQNRSQNHHSKHLQPVTNPTYKETCGACHFAYQPELLPSGSWRKVISGVSEHFGQSLEIISEYRQDIETYLVSGASEHSRSKRARRIMRSLGGKTPVRITEIPYIKAKHHEISAATLKRPSIGSLSNCAACHTRAQDGVYDDDAVTIPD